MALFTTHRTTTAIGEEQKGASDSESDADDDVHLPGLGEEAAVAQLKEKNPGEGKASDLPTLEVPDQELFELLQTTRRGFVGWLSTAPADSVDDVMQACVAASTRAPGVVAAAAGKMAAALDLSDDGLKGH